MHHIKARVMLNTTPSYKPESAITNASGNKTNIVAP